MSRERAGIAGHSRLVGPASTDGSTRTIERSEKAATNTTTTLPLATQRLILEPIGTRSIVVVDLPFPHSAGGPNGTTGPQHACISLSIRDYLYR
jgi:hypothetical protein